MEYATHQYEEQEKILGKSFAETTEADIRRYNDLGESARFWHAAGEISGYTGVAVAGGVLAPSIAGGLSYVAGTGSFGTGLAFGFSGTMAIGSGILIGQEAHSIGQDWNRMDGIERFHRVGMLAGPLIGGGLSARFSMRDMLSGRTGQANQARIQAKIANRTATRVEWKAYNQMQRISANKLRPVSRWGRPGLQSNDWVMNGHASRLNYALSAKWQPGMGNKFASFKEGQTFFVPNEQVVWPTGWGIDGWWKGLFNQRIFVGAGIK